MSEEPIIRPTDGSLPDGSALTAIPIGRPGLDGKWNRRRAEAWIADQVREGPRRVAVLEAKAIEAGISRHMFLKSRQASTFRCFKENNSRGVYYLGLVTHVTDGLTNDQASTMILHEIRKRAEQREFTDAEVIRWVAEHRLDRIVDLNIDDVPNGRALDLLLYAKANEKDFRRMYESRVFGTRMSAAPKVVEEEHHEEEPESEEDRERAQHDLAIRAILEDRRVG